LGTGRIEQAAVEVVEEAGQGWIAGARPADRLSAQGGFEDVKQEGHLGALQIEQMVGTAMVNLHNGGQMSGGGWLQSPP
jgi:hypothetical protein